MIRVFVLGSLVGMGLVLAASSPLRAQDDAEPVTRTFTVATSPRVTGFEVRIDGIGTAITDETGTVSFELDTLEGIRSRISAVTREIMTDEATRFRFNAFQRFNGEGVVAAFNVDYLSEFAFFDRDGSAIAPDRIQELTLRSSVGEVVSTSDPHALWLHGTRVLSNNTPRAIYWTVQDVTVGGSSVVNRSEFRVTPSELAQLDVELLMFDLSVLVQSRLLGLSTGSEVVLEHPDGLTSRHEVEDGRATIDNLPRGEYSIEASGFGFGISRPIALSRDQDVRLHFFPWPEFGAGAALLVALLALPLLYGARRRAARLDERTESTPVLTRGPESGAWNP